MQLAVDFYNFLRMVYQSRYMIRRLIHRDIKARYVGSFLGIFWSIVHPLAQLTIYYFIFSIILKVKLGPEYSGTNFAFWLVAGLLPWLFFAEVMNRSPGAVLEQQTLITKAVFPSEILPLAQIGAALVNHLIGVSIFVCFLLTFGDGISMRFFFLFPSMLAIGIFVLGIAWLLSALNVFLRDIGQISNVFVNLWFFMTPIIYPRHLIPQSLQGIYGLNPMLHAIELYRVALLGKAEISIDGFCYFFIAGLVTFAFGGLIFKKLKPSFADVL